MARYIWQENLSDAILLDTLVLVHGNVKDVFAVPLDLRKGIPRHLSELPYVTFDVWLALYLEELGYPIVMLYDAVDGAVALRPSMAEAFSKLASQRSVSPSSVTSTPEPPEATNEQQPSTTQPTGPALPRSAQTEGNIRDKDWLTRLSTRQSPEDFFRALYENVFAQTEVPVAVICRFVNRYLSYSDRQDNDERRLSLLILKAAMAIRPHADSSRRQSRIILIFDTEGETPQELNVQAPFAHSVLIPSPSVEEREEFLLRNYELFDRTEPNDRFDPQDSSHVRLVANLADGLKTFDLISLVDLSNREQLGIGPGQVRALMDRFKFGTRENAWLKVKPETLRDAKSLLSKRVKGQDEVIDEVIPVLIRAKLGMTDINAGAHSSKPRGVFFFVGPTGVGKTELSKAIAELVFGDEKAMIRFDMSEYSEEHQQARLIGAPPGYVGFDQGGQLTNAIMERPFSVVLFDEIEKAHGRILDKFLQILDDGRLTDGMGRTIYFSEAILIFTSNLGTAPRRGRTHSATLTSADSGRYDSGDSTVSDVYTLLAELPYEKLCEHFRTEVKDFFVNSLGRPEILNRIGEDNILVFKFLNNDEIKEKIVDQQIETLSQMLSQAHNVQVFCTSGFRKLLITHPSGFLRNGARGVRNLLSKFLVNRLAQDLFLDANNCRGKTFRADYRMPIDKIDEQPFDREKLKYDWIVE